MVWNTSPQWRGSVRKWAAIACCFALPFVARSGVAQVRSGPAGFHTITPKGATDSLRVLAALERELRTKPRDAALWYRRGMLAWVLAARDNVPPKIASLDWTLLGAAADTSLRIAADIDPAQVEYKLAVGLYLASSFGGVNRTAALIQYQGAINRARAVDDVSLRAEALVTAGRGYWRFYDNMEELDYINAAPRGQAIGVPLRPGGTRYNPSGYTTPASLRAVDYRGEYHYLRAEELFREGYGLDRSAPGAFTSLARLLVARNRWQEAAEFARARVQFDQSDPWGWLVLGLARYRMRDIHLPQVAFDSALVRLDAGTRARLDRVERVLRSSDSVLVSTLSPDARRTWENLYWRLADPLWAIEGNEPRTEFLARLAYAELRWTTEETGTLGAEFERAEAYIRYGPPAKIRSWIDTMRLKSAWSGPYPFFFEGFDRLRYRDPGDVRARFENEPVHWFGARPTSIDSMATQIVRFRATPDSADVLVAQTAPPYRYSNAEVAPPPPSAYLWIEEVGLKRAAYDSVPTDLLEQTVFHHRLTRGSYVVRSETASDQSIAAGRATSIMHITDTTSSGFALRGSGLSDVLLGRGLVDNPNAARWADVDVTLLSGELSRGDELALLWENYDFAADSGAARYNIRIVIERDRAAGGGIVASIVRGTARAVGVSRDDNTFEISFDRTVPHAPVIVERLAIDLGVTPNGRYRLTITVTDKGSGRSFVSAKTLTIRE